MANVLCYNDLRIHLKIDYSVSWGIQATLQSKLLDSFIRLWHGVGGQLREVHPLDSNGLHIHNADEA
jgi:hypothetical protein